MKFNLKALAAAVVLAAVAGQAAAALPAPTTTTGQSDLIFFAIDQAAGNSFAFDLGTSAALPTLNQNITGAAWTAYTAAEGGSLANTTWFLGYNQGSTGGSSGWGTTVTSGNIIGTETGAKVSAGRVAFNGFLGQTAVSAVGGSAFFNGATVGNPALSLKNSWGSNTAGWTTDNAVGTAANFFTVTAATSAAGGTLVQSGITFNGTSVAAVPEPETYSMLAAGLLMLGAVARRRKV